MKRCTQCDAEVAEGATQCPACGANLGPSTPVRFGSALRDSWIGGLLMFFGCTGLIAIGFALGQYNAWYLLSSIILALIAGLVVLIVNWKKYPSLRTGLLIGLALSILNPLTVGAAIIGIVSLRGPA